MVSATTAGALRYQQLRMVLVPSETTTIGGANGARRAKFQAQPLRTCKIPAASSNPHESCSSLYIRSDPACPVSGTLELEEEQSEPKEAHGKVPVPTRVPGQGSTQYRTPLEMIEMNMEPAEEGPSGARPRVLME